MALFSTQHPDLIARTAGFAGVFATMIAVGVWDQPEFVITPQQNFAAVELTLQVSELPTDEEATPELTPPEPRPEESPEPEPVPEPEPAPDPVPEPEVTPEPVPELESDIKLNPEPPKPKVEPKPELPKVEPKPKPEPPKVEPKPQPKAEPKPKTEPKVKAAEPAVAPAAPAKAAAEEQAAALNSQMQAQLTSLLVNEIKSKTRYPRNAVRRKLEGTVMMEFVVENGIVVGYRLEHSSGHKILDAAAQKLAQSMLQFNTGNRLLNNRILIPIKYELL